MKKKNLQKIRIVFVIFPLYTAKWIDCFKIKTRY